MVSTLHGSVSEPGSSPGRCTVVCLPGSSWEKIPVLHMGLVTERSLPEIPEILDSQYVSDLTQTFVLHWCQTPARFGRVARARPRSIRDWRSCTYSLRTSVLRRGMSHIVIKSTLVPRYSGTAVQLYSSSSYSCTAVPRYLGTEVYILRLPRSGNLARYSLLR